MQTELSCGLSEKSFDLLPSALKPNPSHIKKLDLSDYSSLQHSGVKLLSGFLENPECRLESLKSVSWHVFHTRQMLNYIKMFVSVIDLTFVI